MYTKAIISNIQGYWIEHVHVHVTFKQTSRNKRKRTNNGQTNYGQIQNKQTMN